MYENNSSICYPGGVAAFVASQCISAGWRYEFYFQDLEENYPGVRPISEADYNSWLDQELASWEEVEEG